MTCDRYSPRFNRVLILPMAAFYCTKYHPSASINLMTSLTFIIESLSINLFYLLLIILFIDIINYYLVRDFCLERGDTEGTTLAEGTPP